MAAAKNKKVTFIKSPTGAFNLAYSAGDSASFPTKQANELIKSGYAVDSAAMKKTAGDTKE